MQLKGFKSRFYNWLIYEPPIKEILPYDFNRLKYEIRPGDVLLIEGRSRISSVIRSVMQSPWTHAALYIGRLNDIEDEKLQAKILSHRQVKPSARLIVEDVLNKGTIVSLLSEYENHHLRICRPIGISPIDLQTVMAFAINSIGQPYNVRDFLDLFRFILPWSILPRRWGSKLFRTPQGLPESAICSSLIANAFIAVQFPILPFIHTTEEGGVSVAQRNPYLFTPKDFDYSPYFEIIKYPLFNPDQPLPYYRRMPWVKTWHQGGGILTTPPAPKVEPEKKKIKSDEEPPATD